MKSIKNIYVIGNGPSSSHTMGPAFACDYILKNYKNIKDLQVFLFESLALTGKGHLTDRVINEKFEGINHEIIFDFKTKQEHPNTLIFKFNSEGQNHEIKVESIGGGSILIDGKDNCSFDECYKEGTLNEILSYCESKNLSLFDYIKEKESDDIYNFLEEVYKAMKEAINRGLSKEGVLPGKLKTKRKAKEIYDNYLKTKDNTFYVMASAFAVSEENADGQIIVTAPTCGSSGVIPAAINYLELKEVPHQKIIEGLGVAALIGNLIKNNASIAGAMCGCQAEIGAACSMASALITYAFGYCNKKIAQAAEIALEHSLGLTCDPIEGYVQIPCIERNAIFALKAINSYKLACAIGLESSKISFDNIVKTMYETGIDLRKEYKETSQKGMSKINDFYKS
ncbi:MAG: L-serine ammonia-lyase, iron-sulfur-dependent, subunit alpha [Bacilli bacterium]|nr:L-serine ammonia-lyase, iron-sulfur-dependent, subunit alpha [Bacilli bacterium]